MAGSVVVSENKSYSLLSEDEFIERYELLHDYLDENKNSNLYQIITRLRNLPRNHCLHNPDFFVRNQKNGKSFLHLAAGLENIALINFLKETGHDINLPDYIGRTPLYDACYAIKLQSVISLLSYHADPNLGNREKSIPLLPLLAFIKPEPSLVDKVTAASIVENLIAAGANINQQTGPENLTPLHHAIISGRKLIVQALINGGADLSIVNINGETGLHMVAAYRYNEEKIQENSQMLEEKEIVELIIPYLAAINKRDNDGNTPLHAAVIASNVYVVDAILEKDYLFPQAKILSVQNAKGNTAIHEAVLESKRGPKILDLLQRIATQEELVIKNNDGETAIEMSQRLIKNAESSNQLADNLKLIADGLYKIADLANYAGFKPIISKGLIDLSEITKALSTISVLESLYTSAIALLDETKLLFHVLDTNLDISYSENLMVLSGQAKTFADNVKGYFDNSYVNSLKSVQQIDYFDWKNKELTLKTSSLKRETLDPSLYDYYNERTYVMATMAYGDGLSDYNSGKYSAAITKLKVSVDLYKSHYPKHRSLANAYWQLAMAYLSQDYDNEAVRTNIRASIEIYGYLKEYACLEIAYQYLARTYVNSEEVVYYETIHQVNQRSLNSKSKLHSHFALAGLYKALQEQDLQRLGFPYISIDDLKAYESFHYNEAYKMTQGPLDNKAHVVLQREIGIANNVNLGTYNIQQCVVVAAYEPLSKKIVLSHFDKFSGPLTFMKQILEQFPGQSKIDIYVTGGRDRSAQLKADGTTGLQVSDNNINQVLKQIYAHQERFNIKSLDVGDERSPVAVVFDVESTQLVHSTPNFPDSSLDSRAVMMGIQLSNEMIKKGDYLHPLNKVDFSQTEDDRKILFSPEQQQAILDRNSECNHYYSSRAGLQTEAWKHNQILHPLMIIVSEIEGQQRNDFSQALIKTFQVNSYSDAPLIKYANPSNFNMALFQQGAQASSDLIEVLSEQNSYNNPINSNNNLDFDSNARFDDIDDINMVELDLDEEACFLHRRKRLVDSCLISWDDLDKINLEKEEPRDIR